MSDWNATHITPLPPICEPWMESVHRRELAEYRKLYAQCVPVQVLPWWKRILLVYAALLLTGCASALEKKYTDSCVITQPDKQGAGFTTGTFPCKLQHVTVDEKK